MPVVLFCVWTVVLVVASIIVLACLGRETKKFKKKLARGKGNPSSVAVGDLKHLEGVVAKWVQQFLGQGVLEKLASNFSGEENNKETEQLR